MAAKRFAGFCEQEILDMVRDGRTLTQIAEAIGSARSSLQRWLDADPDRSARAREARAASAQAWDERAEQVIAEAADALALARARELAHHYRWRASKIAPREYGEQSNLKVEGRLTLEQLICDARKPDEHDGGLPWPPSRT